MSLGAVWPLALPSSLALLGNAAWSGSFRTLRRCSGLLLALAALWLPWTWGLGAVLAALVVSGHAQDRLTVGLPALLVVLLGLRVWAGPLPGAWAFWLPAALLVVIAGSAQSLLAAEDAEAAGRALLWGQLAWCAFGLASAAPLGLSGALLLLWQQPVLLRPLAAVLVKAPGRIVLVAGLTLGLAGGPPLSGFNAYFQLLAPLMTESAMVTSMQSKLFSGTGLLAVVATLALLYQTGALGYFYWARVLPSALSPAEKSAGLRPLPQPWAWACLGASLAWGLAEHWGWPGRLALHALQSLHALPAP